MPFIHVILQVSLDSKLCIANMAKELAIMGIRGMNFFVVRFGAYRIGECSITFETHSRTIVQVAQPKFKTYEIDLLDFIMVTDLLDRTVSIELDRTDWTGPFGPDHLNWTVWTGPDHLQNGS